MPTVPLVSTVVVVVHRCRELGACLASLLAQDEPRWEALVVLNGATAEAESEALRHAAADPRIRLLRTESTTASQARNLGLREARAALLYFLDDDVEVPRGGLRAVVALFSARPSVAIAGGPNLTPPDDPPFARLGGELLASRLGTGITRPRYRSVQGRKARERDLTLCNLAARRSLFHGRFGFPELFGGEENVLMGRASHEGYLLWYSPDLWVYHRRRATVRSFVSQMHRYGFGRGIAIHSAPGTAHVAYFVPVGFLGYVVLLPAMVWLEPLGAAPLLAYGALVLGTTLAIAARTRLWVLALAILPPLFFFTHLAYALGLLRGLARGARRDVRDMRRDAPRTG